MKRFVLLIISSCAMLIASAQEEIVFDSIQKSQIELIAAPSNMVMPVLFGDSYSTNKISLIDPFLFHQPLLTDYRKNLGFLKSLNTPNVSSEAFSISGFGFSPLYSGGVVFNQSSYRMNDRLTFGGNSFGAQSVFDQPRMNSSMQNMSTKGASVFMQYKVSKNFKVETRVSISNHQSPWEP